jgi:hypothetical protein
MKCAIMQPHYFPWAGYFNLISKVDKFIFLDDVQFSKNSWQSRNYVIIDNKFSVISVPLEKSKLQTIIKDKIISPSKNWQEDQAKIISTSYSLHPFFKDLKELIFFFLNLKEERLSNFNIKIIKFISQKIKLDACFILSSDLNVKGKRTTKLISILENLQATEYFSTLGAKEYLVEDKFEQNTKIKLHFNNFISKPYSQENCSQFISNLSIIDIVSNLGWIGTRKYIIDNYQT